MTGELALVTGAGSGIGAAIAQRLAADGYTVAVNDLLADRAERVAGQIARAFPAPGDVTDERAVDELVDAIARERGAIRVLVNNAGIADTVQPSVEKDLAAWQRVMDVNVRGVFTCCRRVGREMLAAGGGRVVNIASVFGMAGVGARPAYATSKAAVINLTQTLAVEWAAAGVRVNAVAPGFVRTPLFEDFAARSGYDVGVLERRVPAGRLARPEDVASAVAFLVSPAAEYVNGVTLPVDGGLTASHGLPL